MPNKSIQLGTIWTIIFFIVSFAKTIILTPLMLVHWGQEFFCFWAIILSARAIILFLLDGFVRYVVNKYNLLFHTDEAKAQQVLSAGIAFSSLFSFLLLLVLMLLVVAFPSLSASVFDIESDQMAVTIGILLMINIIAASLQNVQRMYACTKEAKGLVWQNLVFETVLTITQLLMLALLLVQGFGFHIGVIADSGVVLLGAIFYILHLYTHYPLKKVFTRVSIAEGAQLFIQAARLYASNFFEKLTTDGIVLLLSFFRFDKAAIALYATIRTIVNTPLLAQNLLLNTYTPQLQKDFALRNKEGLEKLFSFIRWRIGLILLVGIVCCYPLYEPVFVYWTKGQIAYSKTFMASMLLMAVFSLYGSSYAFVLKGLNILPRMLSAMLIKSLLLLVGMFFIHSSIGDFGRLLAIVEFVSSFIMMPFLLYFYWESQSFKFSIKSYLRDPIPYIFAAILLVLLLVLFP